MSKQAAADNTVSKSKRKIIWPIIFYIIIGIAAILSTILSYVYAKFLPPISSSFFQMLIQVIATLFGFTVVVIFYYQSKFDDQKKDSVKSIIQVKKQLRQDSKVIDSAVKGLKPTYGAPIRPKSAALEDQVKHLLDSFTEFTLDEFEKISNDVIGDVVGLLISFGAGIVLAFLGLFYVDSLQVQSSSWPLLIGIIVSSISTMYNFVMFWKDWQENSDKLYRAYLRLLNL
jgi:hypothetical protein